jgi:hypothetical protein
MDWSGHFPNNQETVATLVAYAPMSTQRLLAAIARPRSTGC